LKLRKLQKKKKENVNLVDQEKKDSPEENINMSIDIPKEEVINQV